MDTDLSDMAADLAYDPSLLPALSAKLMAGEEVQGPAPRKPGRSREDNPEPMGGQEWQQRKGA